MTKPRIVIFSIAYEPLVGGAELAVRNITDRLSSYEFDLITCRFNRAHQRREKIGNVNVYRVGFGNKIGRYLYPALAFRLASRLHREKSYRVAWSIMAAYAGAAALMFVRRHQNVNFLLTLQEGDSIEHIHKQVWGFKKRWQEVFKRADGVQAISSFLADWARKEGAKCPVEVVPNGVNLGKFSAQGRSAWGGKIITTSRLVPKNGIDILIKAFSVVIATPTQGRGKQSLKLLVLGAGPEEGKLKNLAKELEVADRVEFLGNIANEELPKYLAQADIFVRPSRSEGLGSSFLEAMAMGLPVIGTKVGGIPDFLHPSLTLPLQGREKQEEVPLPRGEGQGEGEPNGIFCKVDDPADLAEKIQRLIRDEPLRRRLGQNGRKLVEQKYNWDIVAEAMNDIIRNLTS